MAIIDPFAPQKRAESSIIDPFAPKAPTGIIDPFAQAQPPQPSLTTNPFADQKAAEPPVEPSNLLEFPRGIVRGGINLQNIPAGLQQRYYALGMDVPDTALTAFDKIDAGELKSKKEINNFLGVKRDIAEDITSALGLEKGRKGPGEVLRSIGLAQNYLNASPEDRKKLRDETQAELQEKSKGFGEAVAYSERIKKQAEPYASRLKDFTDIGGVGDAASYFASKLGEAIPQWAPVIASGLLARTPGVVGTSIGMELGPATQDRVEYITKQVQKEPDPEKRVAAIAKYVRDTKDVTLTAATVSGLFDAVLGPEADIAKRILSGELRQQTRREILNALPKVAAKSGASEFLTGGLQETVMINAERMLGEQTGDAFTKENIIRVVDSALSEAIGGLGMSATIEGTRAIAAKKDVAETNTREGQAIRDLDALADREEAAPPEGPTARTLDSLTKQEVEGIQRQLYAELGRPANEQELLGAFNDYLAEQNAGIGAESGTDVAGVSDTGAEQPAGGTDTGAAATPTTGGLDVSGVPADQPEAGAGAQPSTLAELEAQGDTAYDSLLQAQQLQDDVMAEGGSAWTEYQAAEKRFNSLTENTPEEEQASAYQAFEEAKQKLDEVGVRLRESIYKVEEATQIFNDLNELVKEARANAAPVAEEVLDEEKVKGGQEPRTVATYLEGLPQDTKRYNAYINHEEVGPLLQSANNAIQRLNDFITGRGYSIDEVNRGTPDQEVQRAKDLASGIAGIAVRMLTKQDGVDRNLQRANPKQLEQSKTELEIFINDAVENFLTTSGKTKTAPPSKPVFALPEGYAHGTDYLTSQKIIREGRLVPNAGKRMYSYSQFGRKAIYLTARNGWWLDAEKAANGRAVSYDASVPFKLDPKANIREVNSKAELDAIAREIGEENSSSMMRKLDVEDLDYEQEARKVKSLSFEEFVKREVKTRRERLQKYEAPGADTVRNTASWVAQEAAENPEFARSEQELLDSLRRQYDYFQNYEAQYKEADEVTKKLLAAGIDGIYIGPNFETVTEEERKAFDKVWDKAQQEMPNASPQDVYAAATEEYKKTNPTYFDRADNNVASDQLALFRPELAIVDRARLAATKPGKPAFSIAKPSSVLNEPGFKRWFSGSKVVDANGNPLVMYHGTNKSNDGEAFTSFDTYGGEYGLFGQGGYFTDNPEVATGYTGKGKGTTPSIYPVYLSIKNPIDMDAPADAASWEAAYPEVDFNEFLTKSETNEDYYRAAEEYYQYEQFSKYEASERLQDGLRGMGYDGITHIGGGRRYDGTIKHRVYIAFDPEQIKSATGNQGTFDETSPDIRFSKSISDTAGDFSRQPGETIEQYRERLITGPNSKLDSNIVDLIRNNDINGALNAIATKFSVGNQIRGFYGDLAIRLAELNLPTEIRIGDQRNLTRRSIDQTTSGQQVRLFAYLRTKQPYFFDKYFKEYYKEDALETVHTGLLDLRQFLSLHDVKKILGPVINEFNNVFDAYEDNMPGMYALGAYYSNFDVINLNENKGISYHTFLHEVVHAATEILLQTPSDQRTPEQNAAIEELQKLYDIATDNIKVNEYGLTNLSEFIAEVYTNQRFRNRLKAIPYAPAKTNILTRFIQTVMKLVGMDNVAGRAMVEAEKLFNTARPYNIVSAGPRFAQGKKRGKRIRGPISTPTSYRDAESQQGSILQTMKDAYAGRMEWKTAIKIIGPAVWDSKNTMLRGVTLPVLNLTQLEDLTRTKFTQLTGALAIIRDMVAYRSKKLNVASQITADWVKLQNKNFAQSQLMGRIMMEATIRGVDPDTVQPGTLNPEMQRAWNALKPEYKDIYRRVRNFYANSVNEMVREMKRRTVAIKDPAKRAERLRQIDAQFGSDKLVKPYFPLRRFGNYWFQVGSGNFKEFYTFESSLARNVAMKKRIQELSGGNKQQKDLVKTVHKGNGISELYGRNIGTTQVLKDVNKLVQNISTTDVADLKNQLEDSLNQLIYILLPQQSMRKMFINRKAIQGASSDMLRVFATTAVHSAYQQSRFMFAEKFLLNLNNARSEIDGAERTGMLNGDQAAMHRDFINEVEKRVPSIMSNEDTSLAVQVAGKASELTFYYMLSAPFTAILNTLGAVQLAMPYIGGSYGYLKANTLLVKNLGVYLSTVPKRVFSPIKNGTVVGVNFPSIVEGANLSPLLRRAADRFIDNGQIDISITNDVMNLGDRPSQLYTGVGAMVKKTMSGLFHQSERMNREIILMTTFELAYEKLLNEYQRQPGMEGLRGVFLRDANGNKIKNTPNQAFELAIEEATRVAALTLGDFSRQMKGRVFANPAGMVLLKFKQYPILAMYALGRNLDYAVRPFNKEEIEQYKNMLEEELKTAPNKDQIIAQRVEEVETQQKALGKEARRRLAGILGMTAVLGGQAAMPYFSLVIGTLVKMFAGDDDDDYFDWETWFYNYMETEFGGYLGGMLANAGVKPETAEKVGRTAGEVVSRGVPAAMGMAISDRVSLDPKALLWRDGRYSPDARESFIESIIANAGPVVGLGLRGTEVYQLAKEGQYSRAIETAMPAIVAKPMSAVRMGKEGATTKGGDVILDDFTATELAMQAIGLQPERLAQKQKAAIAMKLKEQKILDERNAIMNRLWMERDNSEAFDAALERASDFSTKHPGLAITPKKIRESFKKRATRAAETEAFGADITKKLRSEVSEMGEFAEDEN